MKPETKANKALQLFLGLKAPRSEIVILESCFNFVRFTLLNKQDVFYSYDGITLVIQRGSETHTLY